MTDSLPDGCIVSWVSPKSLQLSNLRAALQASGFSEDLAKDMAPRSAFARAAKQLDDDRIIRKVEEDSDTIDFQFTKEFLAQGELKYEREFSLTLNKESGKVTCENGEMQTTAQRLVDHHIETREASDVTRLVQKIFETAGADLIPIRQQGGCYFVPPQHQTLVSKTRDLLNAVGGKLAAWEISMKSEATQTAASESTLEYMLGLVDEFNASLANIDQETKPHVVQRRLEKAAELRRKLEGYAPLLSGLYSEVVDAIDGAEKLLNQKVTGDFEVAAETVVEPEVTSAVDDMTDDELLAALAAPPEGDIPLPPDLEFDGMPPADDLSDLEAIISQPPALPSLPEPLDLDEIDDILSRPLPPLPALPR